MNPCSGPSFVRTLVLTLSLIALVKTAPASIITYQYTGHLTDVQYPNPSRGLVVGAAITGQFTYDESAVLTSIPGIGNSLENGPPPLTISINFNGIPLQSPELTRTSIGVFNDLSAVGYGGSPGSLLDGFGVGAEIGPGIVGEPYGYFIRLLDFSHTFFPPGYDPTLNNLDLPQLLELDRDTSELLQIRVFGTNAYGQLDTLTLVPEPATMVLAVCGLFGLLAFRRRFR